MGELIADETLVMFKVSSAQSIEDLEIPDFDITTLPEDLQDFIRCCCHCDPAQRSTAEQLLSHPFLSQNTELFSSFTVKVPSQDDLNEIIDYLIKWITYATEQKIDPFPKKELH